MTEQEVQEAIERNNLTTAFDAGMNYAIASILAGGAHQLFGRRVKFTVEWAEGQDPPPGTIGGYIESGLERARKYGR